jgi:muramoyltetrapeptide carboxypeptidase
MTATRREPGDRIRLTGAFDPFRPSSNSIPPLARAMTARLPPPVRPGDRVGVAALSGPVDPVRLERGLAELARLGFAPVPARNLAAREDLFAGADDLRLEALHELADDDSLAAIFFARGGHGALRLLPELDWPRLGRRPRAWIGYSDVTPFLLGLVDRLDLVAFHGPMVAVDLARGLEPAETASLLGALAGDLPAVLPAEGPAAGRAEIVEGRLVGGCLSLLAATLGTSWRPLLDGAIVALEDVGEPAYRIDRMLTHLRLSGSLAAVRGAVLGRLSAVDETAGSSVPERVARVVDGAPVVGGFEFGHDGPNRTLPLGAGARLDPASRTLAVGLDPASS